MLLALALLTLPRLLQGTPVAPAEVPTLQRLSDIDLRPASPWLDFASVGDWVPFREGFALLVWRGTLAEFEAVLQIYDAEGKRIREIALPSKEGAPLDSGGLRAGAPNRICVLTAGEIGVLPWNNRDGTRVGLRVKLEGGEVRPWPIPAKVWLDTRVEPAPNGEFLELCSARGSRIPGLRAIAPDGAVRWKLEFRDGFWADGGIALASDGRIFAWNETDPPAIQIVSPDGHVLRNFMLKDLLPDPPSIRGVAIRANGELFLEVRREQDHRVLHLGADLTLLDSFVPRFPDGSSSFASMRAAPSGKLWIHDGFCFAQLDAHGAADPILGPAPGTHLLQAARPVHITNDGRIFALSTREDRLFELDASGKVVTEHAPSGNELPFRFEDLEWQMAPPELATRYRWNSFDEGRRLWRIKDTRAFLLHADETEVLSVKLVPVQLSDVEARPLAVSRGGLFALQLTGAGNQELRMLDPEGRIRTIVPIKTQPVRFAGMDEQHIALTTASSVELYDVGGNHVGHAGIPSDRWRDENSREHQTDGRWRVYLRPESKELWLRQGPDTLIVRRYALP